MVDSADKKGEIKMENMEQNPLMNFDECNMGTTVTIRSYFENGSSEDAVAIFIGKKDDGLYYFL